jgi:predicted RNase H-like HicB family nuclease
MTYGILVEKTESADLPPGYYYAHVPALGLTTHGEGIEGARAAAEDLIKLWVAEKKDGRRDDQSADRVFLLRWLINVHHFVSP